MDKALLGKNANKNQPAARVWIRHNQEALMQFLSRDTLEAVAGFLKSEESEIALAIAFWGGDAVKLLRIAEWKAKKVRVVCDATSGACNPQALKDLRSYFGASLRTNAQLHAKVYWTPAMVAITSANASASGLSLQDDEIFGNIEAGIASTSPQLLSEAKKWFDELYDSPGTVIVDDQVIKLAEQMWLSRRPGRRTVKQIGGLMDALRDKAIRENRNIWVVNYESDGRSPEGEKQHRILKRKWETQQEQPPLVIGGKIHFDRIDDYEQYSTSMEHYNWNSWVIDLTDEAPVFWYVPEESRKITNGETTSVPLYGAQEIYLGGHEVAMKSSDIKELRNRWKIRIGPKNDKWVPLQDLAD